MKERDEDGRDRAKRPLNLRMETWLVRELKIIAVERGTTASDLVSDFIRSLVSQSGEAPDAPAAPNGRSVSSWVP